MLRCVALAVALLQHASAAAHHVEEMSVDELGDWLKEHGLYGQFGEAFHDLGFDGNMLAHHVTEADLLDRTVFPGVVAPHVRKLMSVLSDSAQDATDDASEKSARRRQLASSDASVMSGLSIKRNNSGITFGTTMDVSVYRGGDDILATDDQFLVQGVDVLRAASTQGTVGDAWGFTHPALKNYFRTAADFTLPPHFTLELWVYPLELKGALVSFATSDTTTCMQINTANLPSANEWHHVVITYDRHAMSVHVNGKQRMSLVTNEFCAEYTGSLVIGQQQTGVGSFYRPEDSTQMYLDTVAIYKRAFSASERYTTGKTCVDTADADLVSLWSGNTRGRDLVGANSVDVAFEGFTEGVNGNQSCTVEGYGMGEPGSGYASYDMTHVTPAVGAVGWVFPGSDDDYYFMVEDLDLPLDWTVEAWVYPLDSAAGTMFFSFAVSGNSNCLFLNGKSDWTVGKWHHFIITWDGEHQQVYLDGEPTSYYTAVDYQFCEKYEGGTLVLGQEQDSLGGTFDSNQAPAMILDTVAIYSRAFDYTEVTNSTSPCINLNQPSLYALYSGYSRGKDLVGDHDGKVVAIEIVSPGMATTAGADYDWSDGDVVFNVDACQAALDEVDAVAPDFTNSLVGGVGWDFLGDSEGYYFATPANFTFPDEFTLEFWAYPRSQRGHLVSFASEDDSNCLLVVNTKFPAYNEWYHIAITYADDTTTLYLNGDAQTGWVWADGFCGDYEGHLVLGQEQDSFLGTFDANQAFDGIIDTVAVYSTAWETVPADKPVGVDLNNMTLYALYSGYTRARDLVGNNDGILHLYKYADGMQNDKANPNTLDLLSPVSVGGVAWNFPTGQTSYYLHTGNDFTLPANDFTIEMWVMPYYAGSGKYFLSFASSTTDNCLLLQHDGFVTADLNSWHHLVATYAKSTNQVTTYIDGTKNMNFLYTGTSAKGFCGTYTGSFVLGQEQDSVGGGFSSTQAADMAVDTVAFYGSHWDADQVSARSGECVNLHDPTLYSLWSGFTKGKDLVGDNDAMVYTDTFLEGAELDCSVLS